MANTFGGYDIDALMGQTKPPAVTPGSVQGGYNFKELSPITFDESERNDPFLNQPVRPSAVAGMAPPTPQVVAPGLPSMARQGPATQGSVPPLYPAPKLDGLATGGVAAPQATPQTAPPTVPAPQVTTQLPNNGYATAPQGVAEGVQANRERDALLFPTPEIAATFTEEEKQKMRGEMAGLAPEDAKMRIRTGTGQAQEELAGKRIVSSLQQQGMTEAEIRAAIGADANPNMTQSQAVTKLKEIQAKKQMQTADAKTARQTEKIAGMDTPDADRFRALEDGFSGNGGDPLGDTLESKMTASNRKEFGRLRDKVSAGRAREGDFTRMENLLKSSTLKTSRTLETRNAKLREKTLETAARNAQTAEEKLWLDGQTKEITILDKRIKEYNDAGDSDKKQLMTPEQFRELLDRRGQVTGGIENYNKGKIAGVAQVPAQTQTPQGDTSGFVVGNTYTDATGNRAVYLGDGKWENK